MAFTCIPKAQADAFKKALKDKDIQIGDLITKTSEERTKVFESFAGKQARDLNKLFEEKLVLKNKVLGIKNFINKVAQEGRYSPAKKAELEKMASDFRAQQQERIFNPSEEQSFLNDLADSSVGAHITREQSGTLFKMQNETDTALQKFDGKHWASPEDAKDFAVKRTALELYTDALKSGELDKLKLSLRETLKNPIKSLKDSTKTFREKFKADFKENSPNAVRELLWKAVTGVSDAVQSTVASLDDSFLGRQGLWTLFTEPQRFIRSKMSGVPYKSIWWNAAKGSLVDFYKTMRGFDRKAVLMTDMYSRDNFSNGAYEDAGILPKIEEQYPSGAAEKIPGVGRAFSASQRAFEGSALHMRMDLYDFISKLQERNGVDITDKYQRESLGKVINSLTSTTKGSGKSHPVTRLLLWAPKMLLSDIHKLTAGLGQDMSMAARKEAGLNLVSYIATTAAVMTIANAIKPGSAEADSRSTDFGKFRWVDERGIKHTIGFGGSAPSLVTLASRLALGISDTLGSKIPAVKTSTGQYQVVNTNKYGAQTAMDTLVSFLENKTTPAAGILVDLLRGKDFSGQTPTLGREIGKVTLPITAQNIGDIIKDPTGSTLLSVLADVFGQNETTYLPKQNSWTQSPGIELQSFKKAVGDQKFKEANAEYDKQMAAFQAKLQSNEKYMALSTVDKQKVITKKEADLKSAIFKANNFIYKRAKSTPTPKI